MVDITGPVNRAFELDAATLAAAGTFSTTTPGPTQYGYSATVLYFGSNAANAGVVILGSSNSNAIGTVGSAGTYVTNFNFGVNPNEGDAVIIINNTGVDIVWNDSICEIGDSAQLDPSKTWNGMATLFVYDNTGWSCVSAGADP